jgi:hypothetical protein
VIPLLKSSIPQKVFFPSNGTSQDQDDDYFHSDEAVVIINPVSDEDRIQELYDYKYLQYQDYAINGCDDAAS